MTDRNQPLRWTTLCRLDEIEPGRAKYVEHAGRAFSVVRDEADPTFVRIFDDACPHAGQSMAGGRVYDHCFVCPWHTWEFRMSDGCNPDNPSIRARAHHCRVNAAGEVQLGE